jgi:thiosulfate/3-mercaptopyruvate sulfurtransferase
MRKMSCLTVIVLLSSLSMRGQVLVSTDWLEAHRLDRHTAIVEVGDRASYEGQHIAGARFIAISDLLLDRDGTPNELPEIAALERTFAAAGIGDRDRVVLYSRDLITAARAFFTLDYLGHSGSASLLDGGLAKWAAEGRAVGAGPPPDVKPSDFKATPRAEVIVRLRAMQVLVDCLPSCNGTWSIVDARQPEQFSGADPGPGIAHGGHIEGAVNVPWQENLTGGVTPAFRNRADLQALYEAAGVPPAASVVVYCRTGMQASVDYFVLRYLGRDVALYDGSYAEWSRASQPATAAEIQH